MDLVIFLFIVAVATLTAIVVYLKTEIIGYKAIVSYKDGYITHLQDERDKWAADYTALEFSLSDKDKIIDNLSDNYKSLQKDYKDLKYQMKQKNNPPRKKAYKESAN